MIFIASPYSHPDAAVREARFLSALGYAHSLINRGEIAFSAIAYGHPFAEHFGAPTNFQHWRGLNHHMIYLSREVHVMMLDGWRDSQGVADEMLYAEEIGRPIVHVNWSY